MAIDFLADLDVFFDADVFGEAIAYVVADGRPIAPEPVAIRLHGDATEGFGRGNIVQETNNFLLRDDQVGEPQPGEQLTLIKTGLRFNVSGAATRSDDGAYWHTPVTPA